MARKKGTARTGKAFGLQFSGWTEMITNLDSLSHFGVVKATKECLEETHKLVTPQIKTAVAPHHRTGRTAGSIVEGAKVETLGHNIYGIDVGFDIHNGGLPSVWLMYGTPRQKPDKKLYQSIYGRGTAGKVAHLQYHIVKRYIDEYMSRG